MEKGEDNILGIQEPGFNFRPQMRSTREWTVVYPKRHNESQRKVMRALIMMNKALDSSSWRQFPVELMDAAAVEVVGVFGKLRIFSIYNNQQDDASIYAVDTYLESPEARLEDSEDIQMIWMGDFNRHSPMWDDPRNTQLFMLSANEMAVRLLAVVSKWAMEMALPAGLLTLEHSSSKSWTRPDNI